MTFQSGCLPAQSFYLMSYPRSGSNWLFSTLAFLLDGVKAEARIGPELYPHTYGTVQPDKFWVQAAKPWREDQLMLIKSHESVAIFQTIYPQGKTLYLLRDGRDALLSYYFFTQAFVERRPENKTVFTVGSQAQDLGAVSHNPVTFKSEDYAGFLATHAQAWVQHAQDWLAVPDILVVRYENLQRDFSGELGRIIKFLDLPLVRTIEEARREYVEKTASLLRGDNQAFHRKGIVGDWKNYANDPLVHAALKRHLGEALVELGYEKDLAW